LSRMRKRGGRVEKRVWKKGKGSADLTPEDGKDEPVEGGRTREAKRFGKSGKKSTNWWGEVWMSTRPGEFWPALGCGDEKSLIRARCAGRGDGGVVMSN